MLLVELRKLDTMPHSINIEMLPDMLRAAPLKSVSRAPSSQGGVQGVHTFDHEAATGTEILAIVCRSEQLEVYSGGVHRDTEAMDVDAQLVFSEVQIVPTNPSLGCAVFQAAGRTFLVSRRVR